MKKLFIPTLVIVILLSISRTVSAEHEYGYGGNYSNSGGGAIPPDFEEYDASVPGEHDDEAIEYGENPYDSGSADEELDTETQEITSLFEKIVNWLKSIFK